MLNELFKDLKALGGCTRLANLTGFTNIDLPVWAAIRPNGFSGSCSAGKGLTDYQSKISALVECYELSCSEQLKAEGERPFEAGVNNFLFHMPHLYTPTIKYCLGYGLENSRSYAIPISCISMDCTDITLGNRQSTVGMGAGFSEAQAMLGAKSEFYERISILAFAGKEKFKVLRIRENKPERSIMKLLNKFYHQNYIILIADLTYIQGWHCFSIRLIPSQRNGEMVGVGHGCDKDRLKAFTRALLEANQGICIGVSGIRDDMTKTTYMVNRAETYKWMHYTEVSNDCIQGGEFLEDGPQPHIYSKMIEEDVILNKLIVYKYPSLKMKNKLYCTKLLMEVTRVND